MLRLESYDRVFLRVLDRLAPTRDDSVTLVRLAEELGWPHRFAVQRAWRLIENGLIDSDAGLGDDPTEVYGRRRP